uniref:Ysc84 actin-binding domain-containing protein n=1 Tax=Grammatophora oceanica TaxID=210454 RepID=A0A7S1YGF1_9STRA
MSTSTRRPDRTTMEGMIWNANHVLDSALDPNKNGVPRSLFEKAVGIILISVIEGGFIFSGNVGTGIILAKKDDGTGWSPPCAMGLTGVGWGFIAGLSMKDVMVFILDDSTMQSVAGDVGIKFSGQGEATAGPFGRSAEVGVALSNSGAGGTVSVAFSKGAFGGISIEGALCAPRTAVNKNFYNDPNISAQQILFQNESVNLPSDNTLMPEIYKKLNLLAKGETVAEPTEEEKEKVSAMFDEAEKKGEEVAAKAEEHDVVKVDIAEEAEKEAAAAKE